MCNENKDVSITELCKLCGKSYYVRYNFHCRSFSEKGFSVLQKAIVNCIENGIKNNPKYFFPTNTELNDIANFENLKHPFIITDVIASTNQQKSFRIDAELNITPKQP